LTELVIEGRPDGPEPSVAGLARLLVGFEEALSADPPEGVVLADDSDEALAAALVATKLLIPIHARPQASAPTSLNGRLIAQLAGRL
jgi:hypothetical protein